MIIKMLAAKAAPTLCASVPLLLCHWYLDPTCQKIFKVFILDTGFCFHINVRRLHMARQDTISLNPPAQQGWRIEGMRRGYNQARMAMADFKYFE